MKKNTFKVMFVLSRNHVNKDGKCSIVIRITVNGEYERVNSTLSIEPDPWGSASAKAIGRSHGAEIDFSVHGKYQNLGLDEEHLKTFSYFRSVVECRGDNRTHLVKWLDFIHKSLINNNKVTKIYHMAKFSKHLFC